MNLKKVSAETVFAAKARIVELLALVETMNLKMGYMRDQHALRCQVDEEFRKANPEPKDEDFGIELTIIEAAGEELTALNAFIKSGHYPLQDMYDVSLLDGTAISHE